MSILFRGSFPKNAQDAIPRRSTRRAARTLTTDQAMRNSVVWACLRLRADLVSTSPVDVYRDVDGRAVEVPTPPVLVEPGGPTCNIVEWLYSTQVDLDRFGNCFGLITARDGLGYPARIELLEAEHVTVIVKDGQIVGYRVGTNVYDPISIWHEKQYTVAGVPVGLAPIAYAALTLAIGQSAQEFAADWFDGSATPAAHLKNAAQVLDATQSEEIKSRFENSVRNGDVFVTGNDWEYEMLGAKAAESSFLEAIQASGADTCRFLGTPGDLVDINEKTGSITYANITQRNLQLLIMNLGPTVTRRQTALSRLTPRPRYVKLNTDAVVLRMDPKARAEMNAILLASKQRAPSEVREKDDLPPFTPEQIAEIQAFTPKQPQDQTPSAKEPAA